MLFKVQMETDEDYAQRKAEYEAANPQPRLLDPEDVYKKYQKNPLH